MPSVNLALWYHHEVSAGLKKILVAGRVLQAGGFGGAVFAVRLGWQHKES